MKTWENYELCLVLGSRLDYVIAYVNIWIHHAPQWLSVKPQLEVKA